MSTTTTVDSTKKADRFLSMKPYHPPTWAQDLNSIPSPMITFARVPTPIHKWSLPGIPTNTEIYVKRDDLTGVQLTGNKARKSDFLMADAVAHGADCVITMGGTQSNHCCTTAVAAKYLNLDCCLILGTPELQVEDPGLVGNLLIERLVGAHIENISWEDFPKFGAWVCINSQGLF